MLGYFHVSDRDHFSDRSYFIKNQSPYAGRMWLVKHTINCTHPSFLLQLQAWWRGTVVRKEIGSFRMPKKEIDSKDSKGKGKGKEKDKRRGKK